MPEYPFEEFAPTVFQELVEALLVSACGNNVMPMGPGRDGGRDLQSNSHIELGNSAVDISIKGYSVFQVKHHAKLGSPNDDVSWLWGQVRGELDDWLEKAERSNVPATLIFVTNVALTPYPEKGGRDSITAHVEKYRREVFEKSVNSEAVRGSRYKDRQARLAKISNIMVLDRHWVNAGIAGSTGVRQAFPQLLAVADVLASISTLTGTVSAKDLTTALASHARQLLTTDGEVWMADGGSDLNPRARLHDLVVDLPVLAGSGDSRSRDSLLRLVIERAEHMMRRNLRMDDRPRHLVLTGTAGNGKTTMAKFIVQTFRSALLRGAAMSPHQATIMEGTEAALKRMKVDLPRHARWPIRIDLKAMLQRSNALQDGTMLSAIAKQLSWELDDGSVTPTALAAWQRDFPWLVVFDGFDEITDRNSRRLVVETVEQFVEEAQSKNADVLVILTTRALGYNDELTERAFERIDLDYLSTDEGLAYAERVVSSALSADPNRQKQVMSILETASKDKARRLLFRTPLQVLILTTLVQASNYLEPDRYTLFSKYFDLAFAREKAKDEGLRAVLDKYEHVIRGLHRTVAFELQSRAESGITPDPRVEELEFQEMIWTALSEHGFEPVAANDPKVQEVLDTATKRLVLLAPMGDGYGFEIRSLQELAAGQWLMESATGIVVERLRIAAVSPHWRNVLLFAAGYAFSGLNGDLHRKVMEAVVGMDHEQVSRLSSIYPVAPQLALEMIDDGMVRNRPAYRKTLFEVGLRVLATAGNDGFGSIAMMLVRIAEENDAEREALAAALRRAIVGTITERFNAQSLASIAGSRRNEDLTPTRQTIVAIVRMMKNDSRTVPSNWTQAFATLERDTLTDLAAQRLLAKAKETIFESARARENTVDAEVVLAALADRDAAVILDRLLREMAALDFSTTHYLLANVGTEITRRAISQDLRAGIDSTTGIGQSGL